MNFFTGFTLQYPLQCNAARGEVVQRDAEQKRAILVRDNRGRQIGAAVALLEVADDASAELEASTAYV